MDISVAAPILPSKSDKVVDKVKPTYHPFCTKNLRGVRLEEWVAQSLSTVNQMQHENAEAFRLVGFGRQKDALHLLRVFAPLVAQLETQVARLQRFIILPISAVLYSCATLHSKRLTRHVLSLYNNATDIMRAANTETNVNATYSAYDKVVKNREPSHYFSPCLFSRV